MVVLAWPAWEAGCAQQSCTWQLGDWIWPVLIAQSTAERVGRLVWESSSFIQGHPATQPLIQLRPPACLTQWTQALAAGWTSSRFGHGHKLALVSAAARPSALYTVAEVSLSMVPALHLAAYQGAVSALREAHPGVRSATTRPSDIYVRQQTYSPWLWVRSYQAFGLVRLIHLLGNGLAESILVAPVELEQAGSISLVELLVVGKSPADGAGECQVGKLNADKHDVLRPWYEATLQWGLVFLQVSLLCNHQTVQVRVPLPLRSHRVHAQHRQNLLDGVDSSSTVNHSRAVRRRMRAGALTQAKSCLPRDAALAHFCVLTGLFSRASDDFYAVQMLIANTSSLRLLLFADRVVQHGPGQPLQLLTSHTAVQLGPH